MAAAQTIRQVPIEPAHNSGRGVTGAMEGWFPNSDGSFSILVGYFNRNLKEELDIPIGASNRIEPGGPDRGQPTHFLARRQWGVFRIIVPRDWSDRTLAWTLVANGETNTIPLSLNPLWEISPFSEVGVGNTPPVVRFGEGGAPQQGPRALVTELPLAAGREEQLVILVEDDAKSPLSAARLARVPPVTVTWSKYRGSGAVTFSPEKPAVEGLERTASGGVSGRAVTTARFGEPGQYTLLLMVNDWSGEGGRGFQCCWTTAHVKVNVK